jgi:predicted GNAT superfamily acetyltransferase
MGSSASAWEVAHAAAERAGASIRPLAQPADTDRVVEVIRAVWGPGAMPPALLRAFQHAGASLHGAEAGKELVGFVLGFLGSNDGLHLHSHMLAVMPEWQSRGVGYALKLVQRAAALDAGLEEIRWTYDPLVARNARFNLNRLGTVATAYLPDFYGDMPDKLNAGDRSDRFEVRWRLRSPRVDRVLRGDVADQIGETTVAIPPDYHALRSADPDLAARWRETTGRAFASCFGRRLVAQSISPENEYRFVPELADDG